MLTAGPKVTLTPVLPPGGGLVLELDGPAPASGGVARWTNIPRARRVDAVEFEGITARQLPIPVILNGVGKGRRSTDAAGVVFNFDEPVEDAVTAVERLARSTTATGQPPVLTVAGPVRHMGRRYVVSAIDWAEDFVADQDGQKVQQRGVITLTEYAGADVVTMARAATSSRRPHTVTVRTGDTLKTIAQREWGKAARWREIARINKWKGRTLRDWRIPAGMKTVRVP